MNPSLGRFPLAFLSQAGSNKCMRKIIRLLLALILGFVAFEVVDLWPVRPMWTLNDLNQALIGFSKDDRSVFVMHGVQRRGRYSAGTRLQWVQYNARTGEKIYVTELSFAQDFSRIDFCSTFDFTKLLVYGTPKVNTHNRERFLLIDTQTGEHLGGPWDCDQVHGVSISPDAKWFCVPGFVTNSRNLLSTIDSHVIELPSDYYVGTGRFSEDSSKLAIITLNPTDNRHIVIMSIPTCQILATCELPAQDVWYSIEEWQGNLFTVAYYDRSRPEEYRRGIERFRLTDKETRTLETKPILQNVTTPDHPITLKAQSGTMVHVGWRELAWSGFRFR